MSDLSLNFALQTLRPSNATQEKAVGPKSGTARLSAVTLDQLLIPKPASSVIFPVRDESAAQYGLTQGDLLIVDRDALPANNQLVIISANDNLIISRNRQTAFNSPNNLTEDIESRNILHSIWGVVTYIIQKQ